eukprot:364637-Chlamydomonas_euryale.AAC.1
MAARASLSDDFSDEVRRCRGRQPTSGRAKKGRCAHAAGGRRGGARPGMRTGLPASRTRARAQRTRAHDPLARCRVCGLGPQAANRRRLMLRYARECEPEEVQAFVESAPPSVVAAMRHTVANIVGTLPSNFFDVKVSTVRRLSGWWHARLLSGLILTA